MISNYPTRDELEDFRDEVDEPADKIMEMVAREQPDAGVAMCALIRGFQAEQKTRVSTLTI
jgi:hypothetical protein